MVKVAPESVTVSLATGAAGVNDPVIVIGNAEVPACALLVHDVGVVTVPALAGDAPAVMNRSVASHTGSATRATERRRRRSNTDCLPLVARAGGGGHVA